MAQSPAAGSSATDDIDLMVVGTVQPAELALPLRRAREAIGREINPTVYSAAEFERKRKTNDPFLAQVMAKQKLFVLGDRDELERAAI